MAIDVLAEEVATNLEEVAEVTRRISTKGVGVFLGGFAVGVAAGFYFGHRWNKEKIKAEAFKESQAEIDTIREFYKMKRIIPEKPSLDELAEEAIQDYISDVPVVSSSRPLKAPVPIEEPGNNRPPDPETRVPYHNMGEDVELVTEPGWDYAEELKRRTSSEPFIIHEEEFRSSEKGYIQVAYTYYAEDDVLTDEDDRPLPHADKIVGEENLKFGHGSGDPNVVFVRNDQMGLDMEISRSPNSFEQEVLGVEDESPA